MERMEREELEKLKDFKVYVFEGDVYVKAEDYKEKAIENKKLKMSEKRYKNQYDFDEECLRKIEEENKKLKEYQQRSQSADGEQIERLLGEKIKLEEENKNLKERIDVLYEFIERNDKLVDEVINEEDLDKLNRYIYIDDDLVDRTLESED